MSPYSKAARELQDLYKIQKAKDDQDSNFQALQDEFAISKRIKLKKQKARARKKLLEPMGTSGFLATARSKDLFANSVFLDGPCATKYNPKYEFTRPSTSSGFV